MRFIRAAILTLLTARVVPAVTLERLSLDEMAVKATAIVRGRVVASWAAARGTLIYTHYAIQVSERWKGSVGSQIEVVVPGGAVGGLRQSFSGVPKLIEGNEYVLFLWTGSSGLTHILGFTQGVFDVQREAAGGVVAVRAGTSETLLDPATGRGLRDLPLRMKVEELSQRVQTALRAASR